MGSWRANQSVSNSTEEGSAERIEEISMGRSVERSMEMLLLATIDLVGDNRELEV